ncbi:hypothetical protein VP01_2784g3, partial [Puccinia sorghi]
GIFSSWRAEGSKHILTFVQKPGQSSACTKLCNNLDYVGNMPTNCAPMILGGELSWTESQIICVVMKSFLSSCGDLSNLYSPLKDSSNKQIITTLIYCVTQRKKVQVLDCVAKDRREPEGGPVAHSPFSWSYHSQNGKKEKEDVVKTCINEKNKEAQFKSVCLKIAFSIDNQYVLPHFRNSATYF